MDRVPHPRVSHAGQVCAPDGFEASVEPCVSLALRCMIDIGGGNDGCRARVCRATEILGVLLREDEANYCRNNACEHRWMFDLKADTQTTFGALFVDAKWG